MQFIKLCLSHVQVAEIEMSIMNYFRSTLCSKLVSQLPSVGSKEVKKKSTIFGRMNP